MTDPVDHDAPPQPGSITLEIQDVVTVTGAPLVASPPAEDAESD